MRVIIINDTNSEFNMNDEIVKEFLGNLNYHEISCINSSQVSELLDMLNNERVLLIEFNHFPIVLSSSTFDMLNKISFYSSIKVLSSECYDGNIVVGKSRELSERYRESSRVRDILSYIKQPIISVNLSEDNSSITSLYRIMKDNENLDKKVTMLNYFVKKQAEKNSDDRKDVLFYTSLMSGSDKPTVEYILNKVRDLAVLFIEKERLESEDSEQDSIIVPITNKVQATIEDGKLILFSALDTRGKLYEKSIDSILDSMISEDRSELLLRTMR